MKQTNVNTTGASKLSLALASIEKDYGKGSVMVLGSGPIAAIDRISSGCLSLDVILGGGWPRGRIVEIYGPESSGKSTLCLEAIAVAQALGGKAVYIDVEHAMDLVYAQKLGVNVSELVFSQPDYGEQALEIAETLISTGELDIVVIDSVAALVPKAEIEGDMGQAQMGAQARLMSQGLRKLTGAVSKSNTVVFFVNQLRSKIGVMFGNPETTTGGNALKFYASVRVDVRKIGALKSGTDVIGAHTRIKTIKNKTFPPFRETEVIMSFGKGINKIADVVNLAVTNGIIAKAGSWLCYGTEKWQGESNLIDALTKDPIFNDVIKQAVLNKINIGVPVSNGNNTVQEIQAE